MCSGGQEGESFYMKKRVVACAVALLCLFTIFMPSVFAEDSLQAQLDASIQKIKDAQYEIDMSKNTLKGIEEEINKANKAIEAIDAEIGSLDSQIAELDARMATTKAEIAKAEEKRAKQEAELEERLRVMYMYGSEGYLEMLFSADSFADFIARADMMKSVMKADRDCVTALENTKKEIEAKNAKLEADKASVQSTKDTQVAAKQEQEGIKAQQDQLRAQNQALIDEKKAMIAAEEAAANEIAAQMGLAGINGFIQTGEYYWPLDPSNNSSFAISSPFAGRIHPITGEWSNHQGIDIAVASGTPILAAGSGTVEIAGDNGGYGNCVVINMGTDVNGNRLATLYAHMSSIATYVGATVNKGDVIGYVGSTGNSTGPHLHYGWMVNGSYVDPLPFHSNYADRFYYVE